MHFAPESWTIFFPRRESVLRLICISIYSLRDKIQASKKTWSLLALVSRLLFDKRLGTIFVTSSSAVDLNNSFRRLKLNDRRLRHPGSPRARGFDGVILLDGCAQGVEVPVLQHHGRPTATSAITKSGHTRGFSSLQPLTPMACPSSHPSRNYDRTAPPRSRKTGYHQHTRI
ncbi:hypothetical protein VTG60DRAFT_4391 [Thermothelomyces hinnuleus]